MVEYPRILVFSAQPFNYLTGLGITLSNLFKDWPQKNIACAYMQDIGSDNSVCSNYFRIGKTRLRTVLVGRSCLSDEFSRWLENFRPEGLYCTPTSLLEVLYAIKIANFYGLKIAVHMLDDWPSRLRLENVFLAGITKYYLKRLFKAAGIRFAISKDMCDAYRKRYGFEFLPFQNCPDSEPWISNSKTDWHADKCFRFVFTGAIYNPGGLQTLQQVCRAIDLINERSRLNIKLEIYSNNLNISAIKDFFAVYKSVSLFTVFPDTEKMAKLYGQADGLLLPNGFGKYDSRGQKYSMPTKLPACMLSGTPILVCAPAESTLSKFAVNNKVAFLVSKIDDLDELAKSIENFCREDALRKELAANARSLAIKEFSAEVVRVHFVKVLANIYD